MSTDTIPCLNIAITRLSDPEHFAIWVTHSPIPGGYVHYDCHWPAHLTQEMYAWQEMFSLAKSANTLPLLNFDFLDPRTSHAGQLMQLLGISLWKWLFQGSIGQSFDQSQGIAIGQSKPLRVRLEIRDPDLMGLPWEIMRPEAGKQSISLNPQIMFSRTISQVDPLAVRVTSEALNILLVLGEENPESESSLQLLEEAATLQQIFTQNVDLATPLPSIVPVQVQTLIQPTVAELTLALDTGIYNIFFYAGHGEEAPNGGRLFLRQDTQMNGTELAQALVRNRVVLAVFNSCWGAQSACSEQKVLERSSLAEVLIYHGVPAVLAMRDAIASREALSFIQAFTQTLTQRLPIDQAVRVARQQLLTLYKFTQPAWTLPILYLHPEFDGRLVELSEEGITKLPPHLAFPVAYLRFLSKRDKICIYGGRMRVGRHSENDLRLQEQWVSQRHGEIICRNLGTDAGYQYFLRDFSRFGTFICQDAQWQQVHHQEIPLSSGSQLKFGSLHSQVLEFIVETLE